MMRVLTLLVITASVLPQLAGQEASEAGVRVYVDKTASPPELADLARIGNAFILGEVGQLENVQLVESSRLDALLEQQKFQQDKVRNEEVVREAQLSGAQWVVFPDLLQAEGIYSFSIRIVEIESGRIAALSQELFSDSGDILPTMKRITRAMLKDFAQKEGISPPSAGAENADRDVAQDEQAAERAPLEKILEEEDPPMVEPAQSREGFSWHLTLGVGGGLGFDASSQVDGAIWLSGDARTGPVWGWRRSFLALHMRYRLSIDLLDHSYYVSDEDSFGRSTESYTRPAAHHLGWGVAWGWLTPDRSAAQSLLLGLGVNWLRLMPGDFDFPSPSFYLGYEILGKVLGVSFEGGFSPSDDFAFVWFSTSVLFPSPIFLI